MFYIIGSGPEDDLYVEKGYAGRDNRFKFGWA
jgi:hypothetical protein